MTLVDSLTIFQAFMLLISISVVGVMTKQRFYDVTKYFIYASFLAVCQNAGCLLELLSTNTHEIIYAIRVEYMGTAFISTFILFFVAAYCRVKIPVWAETIFFVVDFIVLLGVWGVHHVSWYYKNLVFTTIGSVPHVIVTPGFFYYVYIVQNAITFLLIFIIILRTIARSKYVVVKKNCIKILLPISIPLLAYIIYFLHLTGGFDPTPAGITFGCVACCYVFTLDKTFSTFNIAHTSVFNSITEPVIIVDDQYHFLEGNLSAIRVFPEMEDMEIGELLPKPILETIQFKDVTNEMQLGKHTFLVSVNTICENEKRYGFAISLQDITRERKRVQEMKELTIEAEKASRAKSAFLAQTSHEIRTPINSILGMNEMILRESKEKNIREYSLNSKNSAQALLRIINDILDVSKIESGKMELVPVDYEAASFVFDIVCMIEQRAESKGLEFRVNIDNQMPLVMHGDDLRIKQVIINLLSNAVKYTEEGFVSLSIRCVFQDSDVILEVEVQDTGMGIQEDDIPKMFTAFQRVDENKNRSIQGTGLGMYIVQTLLGLMGSQLKVESTYGKGSTFSFAVRQKVIDATPLGDYEHRFGSLNMVEEYETSFTAPEARILVVDDNEMNLNVFTSLIKETQVQVTEADSGYRCLDLVKANKYDLIFLDHMMPGMDGVETLKQMKAMEGNLSADTPVVMLTANALSGAKEEYLALGFDDFLSKPIVPEKLEGMIQRLLPKNMVHIEQTLKKDKGQKEFAMDIPEIDEFDFSYALSVLKTKELLGKTLLEFYHSLDKTQKELDDLEADLETPGNMDQYRIKVHALKSTAAMVGAVLLSKLARLCEVAAIEQNFDKIHRLEPVLSEEITKHKERMKPYEPQEEKKELPPVEELLPMFIMLKNAINNNDYDTSDFLSGQLCSYLYPDDLQPSIDQLAEQILNLDEDEALATCDRIIEALQAP